jgi:hypothetical protein
LETLDFDRWLKENRNLAPHVEFGAARSTKVKIRGFGGAMRYLCQVYLEEGAIAALSEPEKARLDRDSADYDHALERAGHLIHAEALQSPATATTVRIRGGKVSVTDGPFAETKEHLGGFILIEASDLDEAIRIASRIPIARLASVEIRPVYDFKGVDP